MLWDFTQGSCSTCSYFAASIALGTGIKCRLSVRKIEGTKVGIEGCDKYKQRYSTEEIARFHAKYLSKQRGKG